MSDQIKAAISAMWLWRIWMFEVFVDCVIVGCTFYVTGTGDENWSELSGSARGRFWAGMAIVVLKDLYKSVTKARQTLSKGDLTPPDPAGNTEIITRQPEKPQGN